MDIVKMAQQPCSSGAFNSAKSQSSHSQAKSSHSQAIPLKRSYPEGGRVLDYHKLRLYGFVAVAIFAVCIPFVRVNGNHFFMLSFVHQKLNVFFMSFGVQELYLMPFLLIAMFLFIFFITTLLGRVWCGWACPQTMFRIIYRDFLQTKILKLYASRINKQQSIRPRRFRRALAPIIFYFFALLAACNFMWFFVPPEDFFLYMQKPLEHKILLGFVVLISLFLTFDICYLQERFCVYICPYGRIQSVMFDTDTKHVIYDEGRGGVIWKNHEQIAKKGDARAYEECIGCNACVAICPTHIDIRRGMQLDCINCLECVDACSSVQEKFKRPSLIKWSSLNALRSGGKIKYLRFRTAAYMGVISVIFSCFFVMLGGKESMLLNVNRSSQLYSIKGSSVQNAYTFLYQNTSDKTHEFYFEVLAKEEKDAALVKEISIVRPKTAVKISSGGKVKNIVVLELRDDSGAGKAGLAKAGSTKGDLIVPIIIRAYATDDESIFVSRQSLFVMPKR